MKAILVPTDFSLPANNATDYAAEMASLMHAKLTLFHVFHVPSTLVIGSTLPTLIEMEETCMEILEDTKRRLQAQFGTQLQIDCVCKCGFAEDEIQAYTRKHKTDLIVMGMHGAGYLSEILLGSLTSTMLRKARCPVLSVGESMKFRDIKRIALACDYLESDQAEKLAPLREFAQFFKAHIYMLYVVSENEPIIPVNVVIEDYMKLENSLWDTEHTFHYTSGDEVVPGINRFVKEERMDLVVMVPREYSWIDLLLEEPHTKRMAFHSQVPLLALH